MKEILLIRPENTISAREIPLGLIHIGTILTHWGYVVTIVDAGRQHNYKKIISSKINDVLLIGITCQTGEVVNAIEISDHIKHISNVPIIWGGWHPTLFPAQVCSDRSVDFVCVGEGEYTMLELVKALDNGASVGTIRGLAYKDNGTVIINPCQERVDIEALPPVNYHLVDISRYLETTNFRTIGRKTITYQSSRGCPHRCKFCVNTVMGNQTYIAKSPGKVVAEIHSLITEFDIDYVAFIDDNFFVNVRRATEIFELMIDKNLDIKWFAECRADYFKNGYVDKNVLDLAQKSGASKFVIGAESGSSRILEVLEKDITIQQITASAKMLSEFDLMVEYIFMIGIPGETKDELLATLKLALEIYRSCPNSVIGFSIFTVYPEGALTDMVIQRGVFKLPTTLREWLNAEVRDLYSNRSRAKSWHEDPKLINNIIHYARVAYHTYPYATMKDWIFNFLRAPWKYYKTLFVRTAQLRMRHLCFILPIDRMIYQAYGYFLKRWEHIR